MAIKGRFYVRPQLQTKLAKTLPLTAVVTSALDVPDPSFATVTVAIIRSLNQSDMRDITSDAKHVHPMDTD